jgi:hypothetical protein
MGLCSVPRVAPSLNVNRAGVLRFACNEIDGGRPAVPNAYVPDLQGRRAGGPLPRATPRLPNRVAGAHREARQPLSPGGRVAEDDARPADLDQICESERTYKQTVGRSAAPNNNGEAGPGEDHSPAECRKFPKRATRIEPAFSAWKADGRSPAHAVACQSQGTPVARSMDHLASTTTG